MALSILQKEIRQLLKEKKAILLAHYYQRDEIQEIADILGDSLALSIEAARTEAEVLVFAGVHFMAESASILSPEKTVLLPRPDAGCPLADMITPEALAAVKKDHPGAVVVTYINSSAAIKAVSDICCTSANAVKVVHALGAVKEILMIPDGNLARYVAGQTDKKIIPWEGYCPVHHDLTAEQVMRTKEAHPRAVFAAHPECRGEVLALADFVGSTTGIIRYAGRDDVRELIVGTERGIFCQLRKHHPEKKLIPASDQMICEDMKKITLADIRAALTEMKTVIDVPEDVRIPAKRALERMLAVS
ncbi:MAG: quinolinate synthase [Deltaproteobacteria bacterium HGW-Deltaproteobacteria-11]|nr:MAG: quinolinate synthase [Deltaproteobacteria bacterium HGW-Deltaproteobacteria-11]